MEVYACLGNYHLDSWAMCTLILNNAVYLAVATVCLLDPSTLCLRDVVMTMTRVVSLGDRSHYRGEERTEYFEYWSLAYACIFLPSKGELFLQELALTQSDLSATCLDEALVQDLAVDPVVVHAVVSLVVSQIMTSCLLP